MVADNPRFPPPKSLDDEITSIPGSLTKQPKIDALSENASAVMEKIDQMTSVQLSSLQLDNHYHHRITNLKARLVCEDRQTVEGEQCVFLTYNGGFETVRTTSNKEFHETYSNDPRDFNNIVVGDDYWNKDTFKKVRIICNDRATGSLDDTIVFLQQDRFSESICYAGAAQFLQAHSKNILTWPPSEGQIVWYLDLLGNVHSTEFDSSIMNETYIFKSKLVAEHENVYIKQRRINT